MWILSNNVCVNKSKMREYFPCSNKLIVSETAVYYATEAQNPRIAAHSRQNEPRYYITGQSQKGLEFQRVAAEN